MMTELITLAGAAHLAVLAAAALVPRHLDWKAGLAGLPRIHRQMHWTYAGYIVMAIAAFGLVSILQARELANGGLLARLVCGYIALFWGVRLALQWVFDVEVYLTAPWMRLGYRLLTVVFAALAAIYGFAALGPASP